MATIENDDSADRRIEQKIVDTDFHLHIPISRVYDYVEDKKVLEMLESHGAPSSPKMGWSMGYATDVDFSGHERPQGAALNRDEIHEVMEEFGLNSVVVVPGTHLPFTGARYPKITNELIRAYNEYVIENVIDADRNIYASLVVQKQNPSLAAEEIDRLGDLEGFVSGQHWFSGSKLWGAPEYDPIFEKLTDQNLPLLLHVGGVARARYDLMEDSMTTYVELLTTNVGHHIIANVMNMIMNGVFDKFPELDIVLQEAGTNWIPYAANRADEFYQIGHRDVGLTERIDGLDQDNLERMPSEYLFDNMYVTTQPIAIPKKPEEIQALFTACHAEEMFMFSTDWPHHTVDTPDWLLQDHLFSKEQQSKIFHENAENVLRFPN